MNPGRDAGRFAYHLKFLLKTDLIEADVDTKKYCLNELGKMVIDIADRIEKKALRQKEMLVRTSRLTLEEYDTNKIANSLIREAKMSPELAQKVSKEAEKRLLKSRTKYLTAPLVREVVNAILIEKGLEEYRHKLTRLGLPVHEVTALLEKRSRTAGGLSSILETAGEAVLEEYVLLNVFPRDIADAHLSGSLHIKSLSSWTFKPSEVVHDLRFFLQNGLNLEKTDPLQPFRSPPENFESALSIVSRVLTNCAGEVDGTQTIDYFNVFLAPFVKDLGPSKIKEALRLFVFSLSQATDTSLGLEFTTPDFVAEKPAVGPSGKAAGTYGNLVEESQLLASLILDIFLEEGVQKPLSNPRLVVKIRPETFVDGRGRALLLKAHHLASERGTPYFANLLEKSQRYSVFSASGCRFSPDTSGDWEIDTLRAGCIGSVAINLPRIAYECEKDKGKLLSLLKERLDMAARALEIKHRALKQQGKNLPPFLMQDVGGDRYFRTENCSSVINLVGLEESAEAFCGKNMYDDEKTMQFAEEIVQSAVAFMHKIGRRRGKRLFPAVLPDFEASKRLAQLDIERYGVAKVRFSGTRDRPFYRTMRILTLQNDTVPPKSLLPNPKLSGLHVGGDLTVVELGEGERGTDQLMSITKRIAESGNIDFFTYDRKLTYCVNCRKSWPGLLHKCPNCGGIGTLAIFDRFPLI
jgi:ribonucleoside-triphosphate reductase